MLSLSVVALAILVGCFAQAVAGTGLGLISGGILVVVLGREPAIVLLTIISIPMMLAVLWQNRSGIYWAKGALMGVTALILTPLLAVGMRGLNESALLIASGTLIITSAIFLYFGLSSSFLRGRVGALTAGTLSAIMNMLSGSGGPPPALYAVNSGWNATSTRGTLQTVFLLMSIGTLASLGIPEFEPVVVGVAAGAALLGTIGGMVAAPKIPNRVARLVVLSLAALGGTVVFSSGITQLT